MRPLIDPKKLYSVDCIEVQNCLSPNIYAISLACCLRTLFLCALAMGVGGVFRDLALAGANVIEFTDDEPLATGTGALATRMAFDPLANTIVPTNEVGRHTQRMDAGVEHLFFEAEEMIATATYMNLEWVNTRTGYPELYPAGLSTELPRPVATTAPFLSGAGVAAILPGEGESAMRQHLRLNSGGTFRLWVRYQSIRQLPAPFELVIEQGGEELLRQRFNEESAALCRLAARLLWEGTETVELNPGEAVVRLVKVADENPGPLHGPRYVDCLLLTSDLDYIPGGGDLLPGPKAIREQRDGLTGSDDRQVLLWNRGRYEGFFSTSWPGPSDRLDPGFEFEMPRNAHANELLLVSSCVDEPLEITTSVLLKDNEDRPFGGEIEVFVVGHMISRFFDHVPHVLLRRSNIMVAPYHTVGLWLQVKSADALPGKYAGAIELLRENEVIGSAPFSVEIFDRTIPSASDEDLHVLLWGRPFPGGYPEAEAPRMKEKYWQNVIAHGQNVFFGGQTPWSAEEARQRGVKALMMSRVRGLRTLDVGSEEWKTKLREGLIERVKEMREAGWEPHDLWVEAFDEPHARSSHRWLSYARVVKDAAPEVRMWTNPGWHVGQSADAFREWAPYVDIWWPYASNLSQPDLLEVMEQSGKPIGFYIERGWSGFNPGAAWAYFRRMPMLVAKYDLMGCGFWCSASYYHDPWDDLNTRSNFSKAAIFYPGSQGPINTVNSAAWREGLDELLMLRVLAEREKLNPEEWAQKFLDADSLDSQDALRRMLIKRFVQ